MDDKHIIATGSESQHSLRSMLACRIAPALQDDTVSQRCFKIRAAESPRDRRSANSLIGRMYSTRGYQSTPLPEEGCPNRKTFLATDHDTPIGTLTIGRDSPGGLLVDELFAPEVARFRDGGLPVCEFTKLAMDRRARSPKLLAALFHVAYIYAHRINALHSLLIEVNPRHVRYYEMMLGFKVIGTEKHNDRVGAPAVLLSLDLNYAREQIDVFGGKPHLSATERSAYPYFFSEHDEAGIVVRLQRASEDIAHVFESHATRLAVPHADVSMH